MSAGHPQGDELLFASRTIWGHLARGVIGIGAVACGFLWAPTYPWLWLLIIPVALIAFRGCPMCWTLGLVMTVVARVQGKSRAVACADGCRRE